MPTTTRPGAPPGRAGPTPIPPDDYIERIRLDHLYRLAEGRLLRILAPSGYGKTTLAARWVAGERRAVRWIDLGRGHDDPVALFGALRDALAGLADIKVPTAVPTTASNPYRRALEEGLAGTRRPDRPFVLVLDDVHRIEHRETNMMISAVVDRMPPTSTVVLIGRGHHDQGSLGRLRLTPGVVEVTVEDLAFEPSEAYRLLESMGVDGRSPEVADVVARLEGWPAGVRLAGRVLRSGDDVLHVTDDVSLVDYLRGEWLDQLPVDEVSFLREIACLERVSGARCDEILGRSGSSGLLQRLHKDRVVVFALDQRDSEYRMHGLLTRWLSAELHDINPERWAEVHRSAVSYWERNGDVDRAVAHAVTLGDTETLEALVIAHGGSYFTRGLDATVERWLSHLAPERVRRSPGLCALHAIKELHRGNDELALEWLRLVDEAAAQRSPHEPRATTSWSDVLHAALDERPAAELLPVIERARRQLSGGPWAGFACWVEGSLHFLVGDLESARAALRTGTFEAELTANPLVAGHCQATLAIIEECEGDTAAADRHGLDAAGAVATCGGELLPPAVITMASTASRCARTGDGDTAGQLLPTARRMLAGFRSTAPWFNVIVRLPLVRTALLLDDRDAARTVMWELEQHATVEASGAPAPAQSAISRAVELRKQVDAMHVPATGASALTDAERRVLHLLPTNLSLADIAAELYISRNTVKSHVASIYRKTGATRRTEAVALAKAAGLIAPTS